MKHAIRKVLVALICLQCCLIFADMANQNLDRDADPDAPYLSVRSDRKQVIENTPFVLFVDLKNKDFDGEPDFGVLYKNFHVANKVKSRRKSWINGKKSSSIIWQFNLIPNKIGKITIPKLHVANLSSKPLTVEVVEASSQDIIDEKPRLAFMEAKVDNKKPLVQSMVTLNIKLHYARNLSAESFTEPVIKDAIVMPIGRDKRYREDNNGVVFYIFERNYAIFPQKSGKLTLKMPVFDGIFNDDLSGFGNFDDIFRININSMPVRATASDIHLDVKEAPMQEDMKYWIPSTNIKINQEWETKGKLREGEPIVRKVTIKATDLTAEQIPNLVQYEIEGANHYVDIPQLENVAQDKSIVGTRIDNITYIPITAGELDFPEVIIKWWDTSLKSFKVAKMPGKKFTILPTPKPEPEQIVKVPTNVEEKLPIVQKPAVNTWMYVSIGLILLWILTILGWFFFKRVKKSSTNDKKSTNNLSVKEIHRLVEKSCNESNAKEAYKYILLLASKVTHEQITSSAQFAQYVSDDLVAEFNELEKIIYSDSMQDWNGKLLYEMIKQETFSKKTIRENNDQDDLPPLNPE